MRKQQSAAGGRQPTRDMTKDEFEALVKRAEQGNAEAVETVREIMQAEPGTYLAAVLSPGGEWCLLKALPPWGQKSMDQRRPSDAGTRAIAIGCGGTPSVT